MKRNQQGYTDIHSHLLPGVDDGARNLSMTEKMLTMAIEQGCDRIYFTPHYVPGKRNASIATREKRLQEVKELIAEKNLPIEVIIGNEIYVYGDKEEIVKSIKAGEIKTMGETSYILVEFSTAIKEQGIWEAVEVFQRYGYKVIIAHVERYESIAKNGEALRKLTEAGVYLQMNTESVIGGLFDRDAAWHRKLVAEGLISFFGSDAHDTEGRAPLMEDAIAFLKKKKIPEHILERICFENPDKLIKDEYI
ncbi:MAG: hypothetical protein K6G65_04280 [Lachnospiraceae bacterium]|nr:hypothetical protein [Lachnospiraceae bacterium]